MLAFLDESGDPGRKTDVGSSRFFVVALVVFNDREEAQRCDDRIGLLRAELGRGNDFEFHFTANSHKVRIAFLEAVAPYKFFYHVFALDKGPTRLYGRGFNFKEPLYKYVCSLVFENAKPHLRSATVVIDGSGDRLFRKQLQAYLKARMNERGGADILAKVRMERSTSNNLLQLADYVASISNRHVQGKPRADEYRRWISPRESSFQVWPKQ
jgi:hypothetical protein